MTEAICRVHDADDVIPGRICGHPIPCPDHERQPLPAPWAELVEALGGMTTAAPKLGGSRATVWRWATGVTTPGDLRRKHVNALARRRGIEEPFR